MYSPNQVGQGDYVPENPIILAALGAYKNSNEHPSYTTEAERAAARSAVRDVMVRCGLYDEFDMALSHFGYD